MKSFKMQLLIIYKEDITCHQTSVLQYYQLIARCAFDHKNQSPLYENKSIKMLTIKLGFDFLSFSQAYVTSLLWHSQHEQRWTKIIFHDFFPLITTLNRNTK